MSAELQTEPPRLVLNIDDIAGHCEINGEPVQAVGALLRNEGSGEVSRPAIWFRSNQGPLRLASADVLLAGSTLRGCEFIADGARPGADCYYASAELEGVRWRIDCSGVCEVAVEPLPAARETLPRIFPSDIGTDTYVYAYGLFRRAVELNLDEILPRSDYVERQEIMRNWIALQLQTIGQTNHFLFGDPGVLAEPGRFLYHYTTTDTLRLIARSGRLRLGPFRATNDPAGRDRGRVREC